MFASFLRIMTNSRLKPPIEFTIDSQPVANSSPGVQRTAIPSTPTASTSATTLAADNCTKLPVRKSIPVQNFFWYSVPSVMPASASTQAP